MRTKSYAYFIKNCGYEMTKDQKLKFYTLLLDKYEDETLSEDEVYEILDGFMEAYDV